MRKIKLLVSMIIIGMLLSGCQVAQSIEEIFVSPTPTYTATATATSTATPTNTATSTLTATLTPIATNTPVPTFTFTPRPTKVPSTPKPTIVSGGCPGGDSAVESTVLSMVNYQREQAGVEPLKTSSALFSAARGQSQDMATNNFFDHTGSNGSSPFDRMASAGFSFSAAAENIYAAFGGDNTPGNTVSAWMGSTDHRTNMLNPIYTYAGVGYWCSTSSDYNGYFTLDLARP